jgi:hypothetical protein
MRGAIRADGSTDAHDEATGSRLLPRSMDARNNQVNGSGTFF